MLAHLFSFLSSFKMRYNGLQLKEVGDFGDENFLPPLSLILQFLGGVVIASYIHTLLKSLYII
ncbi:MAG: hypothetical protein IPP71_07020 [Bacteroidetes bacterium]|nr:hypothetical protein [Bacteroidota bacterium]